MTETTKSRVADAYYQYGGNISRVARELGISRGTVQHHVRSLNLKDKPIAKGRVRATKSTHRPLPETGSVQRYILTSAQNNTHLHDGVWANLLALAEHYGAEILVSRFTYDKASYGKKATKPGSEPSTEDTAPLWYAEEIEPYVCDERVTLAPGLVWCGEVNILPTASRPLTGFETYTGRDSGIFPHAKIAMESIASGKHEATKFNYTTGTVTLRNYIQKKEGQRADHHHSYGALIAEVDSVGNWFVRQLSATDTGDIYDLDLRVTRGEVSSGHRVEAITWGDIHVANLDPTVAAVGWEEGGMLDALRPRHQFMHDLFDMRARNHHDRLNPHILFERYMNGVDKVEDEVAQTAEFLRRAARPWVKTVIVNSNHDNALERWLREADYKSDPANAIFFLEAQLAKYRSIMDRNHSWMALEWAMRRHGVPVGVKFLAQDESYVICRDAHGGIECGMHGHLGTDGARGSPRNLARMGRKANTGHTHSAGIIDGMYVAGGSCQLDAGYNKGPSSWSHSHIVTYPNGKRAIITMWNGMWRAG